MITIGASQSYALTGRSEWGTPFTLYHELVGDLDRGPEPTPFHRPDLYFGIELEPVVRKAARDHLQTQYVGPHNTRRVDRFIDYMHATPDSLIMPSDGVRELFAEHGLPMPVGSGVLELKTSTPFARDKWQPCPDAYVWQVAHQCVVCDCDWGIIAALIGGRDFRLVPLRPSEILKDAVTKLCREFSENHLEPRIEPEPDATPRCGEILGKLYPSDEGQSIDLPTGQAAWADAYQIAHENIKRWKAEKQEAANHLKSIMKDAAELHSEWGRFTWTTLKETKVSYTRREHRRFQFWPKRNGGDEL